MQSNQTDGQAREQRHDAGEERFSRKELMGVSAMKERGTPLERVFMGDLSRAECLTRRKQFLRLNRTGLTEIALG